MAKYMIMDPREREKFWEDHLLDVKRRREMALAQMRQPANPPVRPLQYPVNTYAKEPRAKPIGPDGY